MPNDCFVGFADLAALREGFFATASDPGWNADADLDGDGQVGFADLAIMRQGFFRLAGPSGLPNDCGGTAP